MRVVVPPIIPIEAMLIIVEMIGLAVYQPLEVPEGAVVGPYDIMIAGDRRAVWQGLLKVKTMIANGVIGNATLENVKIIRTPERA